MKSDFILRLLLVASSTVMARVIVNSGGGKRRKHLSYNGGDYEASGDYFEVRAYTCKIRTKQSLCHMSFVHHMEMNSLL